MTPNEQGRHCRSCSKTVTDFTSWAPQDILAYLKAKQSERICGRFTRNQLEVALPSQEKLVASVFDLHMPLVRKVAAVIVICFALAAAACNEPKHTEQVSTLTVSRPEKVALMPLGTIDTPVSKGCDGPVKGAVIMGDVAVPEPEPMIMGMIASPDTTQANDKDLKNKAIEPEPQHIIGKPAIRADRR